jgi:nucleoside-diphosphate-sugar epimerase
MKVLVTGGGGFVGFHVVRMLRARGDEVRTIARGEHAQLAALGVEHVRGDLGDKAATSAAVEGVDAVVHVAAKAGIWGKPADYEKSNIDGTQHVIDACLEHGVERLVMTSSPSVTFSGGDAKGADESLPYPQKHLYDYGRTKAEAERRVLAANGTPHRKGAARGRGVLLTCALRPHLVFGEGDPHIVPRLVSRAKAGRLRWIGDPEALVDVTYVENAAHAHLLALDALDADKAPAAGKAYFISQGKAVSPEAWLNRMLQAVGLAPVKQRISLGAAFAVGAVMELAWTVLPLKGEPLMTRFVAKQLGTSHWYDLSAARRDLGYEPIVDDETAHARTVAWLKGELAAGRL